MPSTPLLESTNNVAPQQPTTYLTIGMVNSFRLPDLHTICSWKATLNPHYHDVAQASSDWALSYVRRIPEFQDKLDTLKRTSPELLAAYSYPHASAAKLRMCCDFVNILFVIDEVTDVQSGQGAAHSAAALLNAMRLNDLQDESAIAHLTRE